MFSDCDLLTHITYELSKLNTENVTDFSFIFNNCKSLKTLPDISNWNTQKVTNKSSIFYGCCNLSSLPDISKWNTQNVTNIS